MGVSSVDSNLMSRNFVSVSSGESKYVKAARVGAQVEQSTSMNRQQAILEAGMAACAAAKTPAQVALEAKKAARQMRFAMQASVAEESERNLKEIKKHIEEKAKEATENKDSATGKDAVAPDSPLDQKSPAVPVPSAPATEATPAEVPQASLPAAQVQPAPVAVAAGDSAGASAAPQTAVNPSVNVYV